MGRSYLKNLESAPYNPSAVPLVNEYQEQFTQIKNELVILSNSRKPQVVHHNKMIEAAKGLLLDRKNFHRLIAPNTTDYVVGHYLTMYVPDGTSLPGLNSSVTPYTGGTTGDAATTIVGSGSALSGTWRSRGASGTKAEPNDVLHRYYIVQRVS